MLYTAGIHLLSEGPQKIFCPKQLPLSHHTHDIGV